MKKRMNKRAISEMISYVILIAMAVGLSIGVFIWLKDVINVSPKIDCKDGTSLRLDDVACTSNIITITVKNNGNFNIDGFIIQASENINQIPTKKLVSIYGVNAPGYYEFDSPLKPSDNPMEVGFAKEGPVELIQIQPYIKNEKGKIVICEQAVIKQDTSGCGLIPLDPFSISGIISWWSFNGDADDENDINPGTPQGGVSFINDPERGEVASFDGINGYIDVGNGASLNIVNEITISAWIYPKSTNVGTIVAKNSPYYFAFGNSQEPQTQKIGGGIFNGAWTWLNGNTIIPINQWSHITLTYNGSVIKVYLNGTEDGSIAKTGLLANAPDTTKIGNGTYGFNQTFNGTIDDVMIFDRALTPAKIKELYEKSYEVPTAPVIHCPDNLCNFGENFLTCYYDCGLETIPGIVSWWRFNETDGGLALDSKDSNIGNIFGNTRLLMHFDEGAGTTSQDNSSYDSDGTITSAIWTGGKSGNALNFSGIDDYVRINDKSSLRFTSSSDVSIEFWAKLNDVPGWIIHNYDGITNYWQMELRGIGALPGVIWSQWRTGANYLRVESVTDLTNVVGWHHIVVVYKGSEKNASIYIDGKFENSSNNSQLSGNFYDMNNILIGKLAGENISGTIDEVAIYSKALSQSEITEHFNAGKAKFTDRIPGKSGNALSFDGVDDYVNVSDSPGLRLGTQQTVGAWINVGANSADWRRLVGKGYLNDRNYGLWRNISGNILFQIYIDGANKCEFYNPSSSGNIAAGSGWHHIVGTYNGSVGRLYINGSLVHSSTCSITPPTSISPLTIGSSMYGSFNGLIDEVIIFNQALNETVIYNIYCKQGGSGCP